MLVLSNISYGSAYQSFVEAVTYTSAQIREFVSYQDPPHQPTSSDLEAKEREERQTRLLKALPTYEAKVRARYAEIMACEKKTYSSTLLISSLGKFYYALLNQLIPIAQKSVKLRVTENDPFMDLTAELDRCATEVSRICLQFCMAANEYAASLERVEREFLARVSAFLTHLEEYALAKSLKYLYRSKLYPVADISHGCASRSVIQVSLQCRLIEQGEEKGTCADLLEVFGLPEHREVVEHAQRTFLAGFAMLTKNMKEIRLLHEVALVKPEGCYA